MDQTSPDADSHPVPRARDLLNPATIRSRAENVARYIERHGDQPIPERCEYCGRECLCEDNCPNGFRQDFLDLQQVFEAILDMRNSQDGLLDWLAEQGSSDPLPGPSDADEPDPDVGEAS